MTSRFAFNLGMALLVGSGVIVVLLQRDILFAESRTGQAACFLLSIPLGSIGLILAIKSALAGLSGPR